MFLTYSHCMPIDRMLVAYIHQANIQLVYCHHVPATLAAMRTSDSSCPIGSWSRKSPLRVHVAVHGTLRFLPISELVRTSAIVSECFFLLQA